MLKRNRLLSCIICLVMTIIGIPFSAEATLNESIVAQDEAVFQKADSNEISASFSAPAAWKQKLTTKNSSLTKSDLSHDSIQTVLDQSGITGLSKYQYYLLLFEEDFENFIPNQLLVSFSSNGSSFANEELNALVKTKEEVADLFHAVSFKETYSKEGLMALLEKVISDSNVVMAQPNFLYHYDQYEANMEYSDSSMHVALEQVNAPLAWDYATGRNVKVGMIDTGVTTHGVTLDAGNESGCPVATRNHGSAVAMVIAGHGRQYGVAPGATICCKGGCIHCHYKENDDTYVHPGESGIDGALLSENLNNLISTNHRIINLSLSWSNSNQLDMFLNVLTSNPNVLFVQSAGNLYEDLDTNATYTYHNKSNYIRVAAVDRYDNLSGFSSHGNETVHIAAPGEGLIIETSLWGFNDENLLWKGTSFAAPFVSGAAALLLELDSTLTAAEMKNILLNTADTIDDLIYSVQGGRRLNVGAAVLALSPDYSNRHAYIDSDGVLWAKDNVNTSWISIDTNVKNVVLDSCRVYYLKKDKKLYFRDGALTSSSIAIDTTGTITSFAVYGPSLVIRKGTTLTTYTLNETTNTFTANVSISNISKYTLSGNMLGYVTSDAPRVLKIDTQIHDAFINGYYSHRFSGNINKVYSIGPRIHLLYGSGGYSVCDLTHYDDDSRDYSFITKLKCYDYYDCNYIVSTGIVRRIHAIETRLNFYRYSRDGYEVSGGNLTAPNNSNITDCKVMNDRTLFLAGGNLYGIKGFSNDNTTPVLLATAVKSFKASGNIIAIVKTNGKYYTKTGSLTAAWTLQASSGVSKYFMAP